MNNGFDDFVKDLEDHKRQGNRADFYKLQNGDNKIVLLTNPVGYSECFGIGIAYKDCGYGKYASRKYKSYVLDLNDDKIKLANFSYTVAKDLHALSQGARTKFDSFPVPYVINLRTENAGKKEVKTNVLADEDYKLTPEQLDELASYDSVRDIIDRLEVAQKKKVEEDPEFRTRVINYITQKEQEEAERKAKKEKDSNIPNRGEEIDTIEYPEEEINLDDIPF